MASTNRTSFTITQPFLGAPLQFQPALGSKELEDLVNAYVVGNGSKQDKLSVVTVDFFNLATVDLNTGALTKTYEIFPFTDTFEQSPIESQSSGFSPPIFTPSPGSSATFGDSGYGSFSIPSMTPPTRTLGSARVTKKVAKKDTKKPKVDEARLPGFSILTKDGIDVTTTAGRGTKTKEQREHAHLMRIMKACDACKRKKIRCDPSHRRSHTDMSRASTTTTQSSSASARLSPQYESSPGSSGPALTRQSTQASQSTAAFTPSNAIDDFILFPEDSSWNPELSQADLGQFNFDINNDMDFAEFPLQNDFSFYQQPFNGGDFSVDQQIGHSFYQQQPYSQVGGQQSYTDTPLMTDSYNTPGESYDLDQYMPVSHSRPHPSGTGQNMGQLDNSQQDWPEFSISQRSGENGLLSSTSDWSVLESTMISDSPGRTDQFLTGLASIPQERVSSGRSPLSSRSSRANNANADGSVQDLASTLSSGNNRAANATNAANVDSDLNVQSRATISNMNNGSGEPSLRYDSGFGVSVDPSDIFNVPLLSSRQRLSSAATVLSSLSDNCRQVSESLQTIQSSRSEYTGLGKDLQRLRSVVDVLQSRQTTVPESVVREAREFQSQLDTLSAQIGSSVSTGALTNPLLTTLDPDFHTEFFRQCQVEARRLVRSLCATINTVQVQNTGTYVPANTQTLTSGRNLQLFPSPSQGMPRASPVSGAGMWTESTAMWQANNGPSANVLREDDTSENLRSVLDVNEFRSSPMSESESGTLRLSTIRNVPVYSIMIKDAQGQHERLDSQRTDGTSPQDVLSVLTVGVAEDHSSVLTYSGMLSQHNDLPMECRTQTSSSAQYVDSSEETVLSISPRSAILQTTAAVQELTLPSSWLSSSLPLLVVLTVLGSLFLCSKVFSAMFTSPLAALVFTQGIQALTSLRESCTGWIGNDAFSAAKLALCAIMVAQLPIPTKSNLLCGGAALFHLLTGSGAQMSLEELRTSNVDVDREDRCANAKGLLGMIMDVSPVIVV